MTSTRRQEVIEYIEQELRSVILGGSKRFSSPEELATRFGFAPSTIRLILSLRRLSPVSAPRVVSQVQQLLAKEPELSLDAALERVRPRMHAQSEVSPTIRHNIIDAVARELGEVTRGERVRRSTIRELAASCGCDHLSVSRVLREAGLSKLYFSAVSRKRHEDLILFAREERDLLERGEIELLSPLEELGGRFGLSPTTVKGLLTKAGLQVHGLRIRTVRRRAHLIGEAEADVESVARGEKDRLESLAELGARHGFAPKSVQKLLGEAGVVEQRSQVEQELIMAHLLPSADLAWFVGVIVGGGTCRGGGYSVTFTSDSEPLVQEVARVAARLIPDIQPSRIKIPGQAHGGAPSWRLSYYSHHLVLALGDLRRSAWAGTFRDKYAWILKNPAFCWRFLAGLVETRCSILKATGRQWVFQFNEHDDAAGHLISDILWAAGVHTARVSRACVSIRGVENIRSVAHHIHAVNPTIEARLAILREMKSNKELAGEYPGEVHRGVPLAPETRELAVAEWTRLRQQFGRPVRSYEIQRLRHNNETPFSIHVYNQLFAPDGSFITATEELERVVAKQEGRDVTVTVATSAGAKTRQLLRREPELLVQEWVRLRSMLGHVPGDKEIERLHRTGQTPFSSITYTGRYGLNAEGRKRFSVASVALEQLMAEQGELPVAPTPDRRRRTELPSTVVVPPKVIRTPRPPKRPKRSQEAWRTELARLVEEDLERWQRGDYTPFLTQEQVAVRLGLSSSIVMRAMRISRIAQRRRAAKCQAALAIARQETNEFEQGSRRRYSTIAAIAGRVGLNKAIVGSVLSEAGVRAHRKEVARQKAMHERARTAHPPKAPSAAHLRRLEAQAAQASWQEELNRLLTAEFDRWEAGDFTPFAELRELATRVGRSLSTVTHFTSTTSLTVRRKEALAARNDALCTLVESEIAEVESGVRTAYSTNAELGRRFGLKELAVLSLLVKLGLTRRRVDAMRSAAPPGMTPSGDYASLLGLLALGGYVSASGTITLSGGPEALRAHFSEVGERVFGVPSWETVEKNNPVRQVSVRFSHKRAAMVLGDLHSEAWARTIKERHAWILANVEYLWSFLSGITQLRGRIYTEQKAVRIEFNTSSREAAEFLCELLSHGGIAHPQVMARTGRYEGIRGVAVFDRADLRLFASRVVSPDPEKQAQLAVLRALPDTRRVRVWDDAEIVQEWMKAIHLLGHAPTTTEWSRLHREGRVRFSLQSVAHRFGNRSFVEARRRLEAMRAEQQDSNG